MTPNLPPPSSELSLSLRIDPSFAVDRPAAQLHDLAILTAGREAAGHGIYIDQGTLTTALAAAQQSGGKLRGAIRHPSMLDMLKSGGDRVVDMPGFFSGLSISGNKLVAGTFEFFDSFRSSSPDIVERILEMAAKTPELFGLSAEPCGRCVWVAADGQEFAATQDPETGAWLGQPKGLALANLSLPTLRVTHLGVAAFVDQPAANDGLFARLGRLFSGRKDDLSALRDLATSFLQWSAAQSAPALSAVPPSVIPTTPQSAVPSTPQSAIPTPHSQNAFAQAPVIAATATMLSQLATRYSADTARFARACSLSAAEPALTVEAVEARLAAADVAEQVKQLGALTAEKLALAAQLTELTASLSAAKADAAQWQAKFEAIKASGHSAPLSLSDPAAKPAGSASLYGLARAIAAAKADCARP